MLKKLFFLIVLATSLPTLVLAKSGSFLTFSEWKAEKIQTAIANQKKMEASYFVQNKNSFGKTSSTITKAQSATLGDIQNALLAVQTAKHLKLDDYLAAYWAPKADLIPIERVALDLNPSQVKELLRAYVDSIGLGKTQINQDLKIDRMSSK